MSYERPTPPPELSAEVASVLDDCAPDQLRVAASYADALAEYREREARVSREGEDDTEEQAEERPEGVPSKATTTVKEINGNRYRYWQWRDGEKIRSKYKGPVDGEE